MAGAIDDALAGLESTKRAGIPLIVYGDAPGSNYLFGMRPAIPTTWPALDSYRTERFIQDMDGYAVSHQEKGYPLPVIITGTRCEGAKYERLLRFIAEESYRSVYEDDDYTIYVPSGGGSA